MKGITLKHWLAGAIMLAAAAAAVALKPSVRMADHRPINLEQMIPLQFGDWKLDQSVTPVQVDPEVQAKLDKIYSQVLSRTYINGQGERVMLSIAYGGDQSDAMKAHLPDVCYPAQGFFISKKWNGDIDLAGKKLKVRRLVTEKYIRKENVSYWIMVGHFASLGGLPQKLSQIKYGLNRIIPDGMIIRISDISDDPDASFKRQDKFIGEIFSNISYESAKSITGITR